MQEMVELPQRGKTPGGGRGRHTLTLQIGQIAADIIAGSVRYGGAHKIREMAQIPTVGIQGVLRRAPFHGKHFQKIIDVL